MPRKSPKNLTLKEIEKLLNQQTVIVLNAVDQRILKLEKRLNKMEIRINQKIDRLTTTLDKFLKRMTKLEDEFELMKADLKRVKVVIKEKLGVTLD
jgi:hypothetical protein